MADIRYKIDARSSPDVNVIQDLAEAIINAIEKSIPEANRGQVSVAINTLGDGYSMDIVGFKKKSAVALDAFDPTDMQPGSFNYSIVRQFNFDEQILDLDTFIIDKDLQGQGISRTVHKLQLKTAKKLGFKGYQLNANMDVGGYAWLKAGMSPPDVKSLRFAYQNKIFEYELDEPITDSLKVLEKELDKIPDSKLLATIRKNPERYKEAFLDTSWRGGLQFDDPAAMDMLEKYIDPVKIKKGGVSNYYIDIATRHQVYLERLKTGLADDYDKVITGVNKDITTVLARLEGDKLGDLPRKEFKALLTDLRTTQLEAYSDQTNLLVSDLQELAGDEVTFEIEAISKAATVKQVKAAVKVWQAVQRQPLQSSGQLLDPFLKELTGRQILRVENQLRTSRAQGMTIGQTVRAIRGTKANNYTDGVLGKNWSDARTVVRTATQHVSSQARTATWMANDDLIKGYQWVSTLDGVTSATCRTLDSNVFKLGEGPLPPIHPNCRSTHVPYFRDTVELFSEGATRSAEFGPVKANVSYYDWLKRQPVAFQNDAIGVTRGKLLRGGGLSSENFADLQLNKNFKSLTLAEMRELKPNAFERAGI